MTIENTDPRLTAYALGELQGAELAAFEAELARNETARAEVEAIRSVSRELERELAERSGLKLRARHTERITETLTKAGQSKAPPRPARRRLWAGLSAAAMLALVAVGVMSTRTEPLGLSDDSPLAAPAVAIAPVETTTTAPQDEENEPRALKKPTAGRYKADPGIGKYEMREDEAYAAPPAPQAAAAAPGAKAGFRGGAMPFRAAPQRETYDRFDDNPFTRVEADPRSTFSIDVDTASYALVRRFLNQNQAPPKGAVRIEELVNYFSYAYAEPHGGAPFSLNADVANAPWAPDHRLVRVGLKARHVGAATRQPANLVFLIDVSGSMEEPNKLPLVKEGLTMLARQLDERDHVSIVVYAGASGLVLPPTSGSDKGQILGALDRLQAGGSTNGGQGIELAYATAERNFVRGGINRVILATDGDFNVGVTSQSDLVDLIQRKAKSGVFLSVLGFGQGNYQDSMLEKLADKGNGNYSYIDGSSEARKVLVQQASSTLITVAKDVKIQVEFNPREVEAFRLIGYENRKLAHRDFNDDRKDAGEIGADHTVTALYELIPAGGRVPGASVDDLKYQKPARPRGRDEFSGELLQLKLRYKLPNEDTSRLTALAVRDERRPMSADFRFAAAVAEFGMLLRNSPYQGSSTWSGVLELAQPSVGDGRDREARREFLDLVRKAERSLAPR